MMLLEVLAENAARSVKRCFYFCCLGPLWHENDEYFAFKSLLGEDSARNIGQKLSFFENFAPFGSEHKEDNRTDLPINQEQAKATATNQKKKTQAHCFCFARYALHRGRDRVGNAVSSEDTAAQPSESKTPRCHRAQLIPMSHWGWARGPVVHL